MLVSHLHTLGATAAMKWSRVEGGMGPRTYSFWFIASSTSEMTVDSGWLVESWNTMSWQALFTVFFSLALRVVPFLLKELDGLEGVSDKMMMM